MRVSKKSRSIFEPTFLRDIFASSAMQGLISDKDMSLSDIAKVSYTMADHMLRQRKKRKGKK